MLRGIVTMQDLNRLGRIVLLWAALPLAGCDGTSAVFNPPTDPDPEPPTGPPPIAVRQVFTQLAFEQPLLMLQAPGDSSRWFVVERRGAVRSFPNDPNAALGDVETFIDITTDVDSGPGEAGLLGMAFHPDFAANGQVLLSYTRTSAGLESVISRFAVDQNTGNVDPASEQILLTVPQPFGNHNGGNIVFGPDGLLYIGFGDGGGGGDPEENGQDTSNLLGSIARIDVDGSGAYTIPADNPFAVNTECRQGSSSAANVECPEIFAWGFRNPWRFSFDSETGELWLGDVGQSSWEEVDRVEISENYGWDEREGAHCFEPQTGCSTANVDPITEYANAGEDSSITGGYVYRGSAIPDLVGFYVFGDFGSGRLRAVAADSEQGVEPDELLDTALSIASFAESETGELLVIDISAGTLHQIVEP